MAKGHPAINFLLLLAIVDDAIGLGIIAVFYGDPQNPVETYISFTCCSSYEHSIYFSKNRH